MAIKFKIIMNDVVKHSERLCILFFLRFFFTVIEPIFSTLLAPLDSPVTNYDQCGLCEDENAVCTRAADETTCWCRSGYAKNNNRCGL